MRGQQDAFLQLNAGTARGVPSTAACAARVGACYRVRLRRDATPLLLLLNGNRRHRLGGSGSSHDPVRCFTPYLFEQHGILVSRGRVGDQLRDQISCMRDGAALACPCAARPQLAQQLPVFDTVRYIGQPERPERLPTVPRVEERTIAVGL